MRAEQFIDAGLGILLGEYNDQRQLRQQGQLSKQQIEAQKQMGLFNQQLALEMWDKTGPLAQRKGYEKAGLNPGLMYGIGGGGGQTASSPTGNVQGGTAPAGGGEIGLGIQLGLAKKLQEAQISNIEADTKVKEKEAGLKPAQTANVEQQTTNAKLDEQLKQLEISIKTQTFDEVVRKMQAEVQTAEGNAEKAKNEGRLSTEAYAETIQQIKQTTIEGATRITLQKAQIKLNEEQQKQITNAIWKAQQEIAQGATKLNQEQQKILIQRIQQELSKEMQGFNLATPEKIKQWTEMFTDIIGTVL